MTKHPMAMTQITRRWRGALAAAALVAGLVAAPAAEASRAHSLHGVVVHLQRADRATARVVAQPGGAQAGMYLAQGQQEAALAAGLARSIVAGAKGPAATQRAATVLGLFADHQTSEAQSLTSVLGDVAPDAQAGAAQAISADTSGRGVVLGILSGLLPSLPAASRPVVAQVVAMESSQGAQIPVQLAGVLGSSALPCTATGAVQQALVVSIQAFQLGLSDLGPALALVPGRVRALVASEINGIPDLLRQIEAQLATVVPCAGSAVPAATPVAAVQSPTLLGGMTQLIDGILGGFLPGLGVGQTPAPVAAPAPLTGLLGGLTSLFGGVFGLRG